MTEKNSVSLQSGRIFLIGRSFPVSRWLKGDFSREDWIVALVTGVFAVIFLIAGNRVASVDPISAEIQDRPVPAKVLQVLDHQTTSTDAGGGIVVSGYNRIFSALITGGDQKGETVTAVQSVDDLLGIQMDPVDPGDRVLLYYSDNGSQMVWMVGEFDRTPALGLLGGAFLLLLLLFGQTKGARTIFTLGLTCGAVFFVFVPAVLSGQNIYFWSSLICAYVVFTTLVIVSGCGRKTLCAGLGCMAGIGAAAALSLVLTSSLHLTGMVEQETSFLYYLRQDRPLDLLGVLYAGILIGAMGALMDVAMSIASALWELRENGENPTFLTLTRSGFAIGRDMMGTMSNTLILAYIGSSMSTVLLLAANNDSLRGLLSREMVAVEVLQALVGSIGILLTIPFTTIICAWLYLRGKNPGHKEIVSKTPAGYPGETGATDDFEGNSR